MIFPNVIAGVIAAISIGGVNAGPCRPSTTTSSETTGVTTSNTAIAETSFATSTVLATTGLDFTTDLTSFITLTADTTTSDLASTTSGFVPADLFPCQKDSQCVAHVELCDTVRCGCIDGFCAQITDTPTTATSATADETTTSAVVDETATTTTTDIVDETTTTAAATTTSAEPTNVCQSNEECDELVIEGYSCMEHTCECVNNVCNVFITVE